MPEALADLAAAAAAPGLRVGYLHLGKAESGVRRYGRIVAAGAAKRPDLGVVEADAGDRSSSFGDLRRAASHLRPADVVHIQWKLADWGGPRAALPRLELFLDSLRRPLVVTLHDVYARVGWRERWLDPGALGTRRLSRAGRLLVVHSEEERHRLGDLVGAGKIRVVPHFVEERDLADDREGAKRALGLEGRRVITVAGFMTRRKGHRLVLDALPLLPDDVVAIFSGAAIEGREVRVTELQDHARELGVSDRVRFTGYVPDAELERILAATDVALCPFRDMSASGSVATWLSTGRPIVTSDLPAFRELDALAPGALRMFQPLTSAALAARITATLADGPPEVDPAVARLREVLLTPRIVERYAEVYRTAAAAAR